MSLFRTTKNKLDVLFKERHPVFKFLLAFMVCMVIFYMFYYSSVYKNYLEISFIGTQASISNAILNLLGHDTQVLHTTISSIDFSVNIKNGCDGLDAIAIFISGILIFPTSIKLKIRGILLGGLILFILNVFRIAGLYLIGLNFSEEVFEVFHVQGGFIVFTMISVIFLLIWMNWTMNKARVNHL